MAGSFGRLAIVLIGSLIIRVISVHVCIPITLKGNLSWNLTAGVAATLNDPLLHVPTE